MGQLGGLYGVVALLHVVGWGLSVGVASRSPAFAGAGVGEATGHDGDRLMGLEDGVGSADRLGRLLLRPVRPPGAWRPGR
jgi:hypothetical protein